MPSYCYCPVSGALSFLLSELLSSASDLPLQRRLDHIPALLKVLERIVSGPRQGSMRERDVLQTGLNGCPSNRVWRPFINLVTKQTPSQNPPLPPKLFIIVIMNGVHAGAQGGPPEFFRKA